MGFFPYLMVRLPFRGMMMNHMTHKKQQRQIITAGLFLAFSILLLTYIIPVHVQETQGGSLSPRFMPYFSGILMLMLSALVLVSEIYKYFNPPQTSDDDGETSLPSLFTTKAVYFTIAMGLFVIGFEHWGYLQTTFLVSIATVYLFGDRNIISTLSIAALITLVSFSIFHYALGVYLL